MINFKLDLQPYTVRKLLSSSFQNCQLHSQNMFPCCNKNERKSDTFKATFYVQILRDAVGKLFRPKLCMIRPWTWHLEVLSCSRNGHGPARSSQLGDFQLYSLLTINIMYYRYLFFERPDFLGCKFTRFSIGTILFIM